ncbi:MAG: transglutaminase-like domain-containing protein [Thermodesulfobacteriota bacterium]
MDPKFLSPTPMIDSDNPKVVQYAMDAAKDAIPDKIKVAIRLYYRVRDDIRYDPYTPFHLPEHYRAGAILERKRGYCVPKASLLCAMGRACRIPTRIGFATVKNHLATRQLIEYIGSDIFVYHGYVEFYLNNKWVKATPAFNAELCFRHRVAPLEFNGKEDSIFQSVNLEEKRFMEYIEDHGTHADIPLEKILSAWKKTYGHDRVERWIAEFEKSGSRMNRNFFNEELIDK